MASPEILAVEDLLQPISEEAPCGVNVRDDTSPSSSYYKIKDARSAARDAERQLEASDEGGEPPNWRAVEETGLEILRAQSKDLEIAAWVTEALLRRHGFAGLRDGFRLMHGLIETFWDGLYPPEDEGVIDKVAPLTGLNGEEGEGTLIVPIRRTPLTDLGSFGALALYQHEQARELATIDDEERLEQRKSAGAITLEQFESAARESGADFYRALLSDLNAALEAFGAMNALLDERCGADAPPSSNIRNVLQDSLEAARQISRDLLPDEELEPETAAAEAGAEAGNGAAQAAAGGPAGRALALGEVQSRDEAFKALRKIAEYFRRTEPHSPISYALEQAVRWGRLDLPSLMRELIADDSTRQQFFSLTGIKDQEPDDGY